MQQLPPDADSWSVNIMQLPLLYRWFTKKLIFVHMLQLRNVLYSTLKIWKVIKNLYQINYMRNTSLNFDKIEMEMVSQ